jgi:arylsulfatase A-like enzyme
MNRFILLLVFVFLASESRAQQRKRPNFIFILSDDQRQDALGISGNKIIKTPQLDQLLRKAVRFSNAQVVLSLCSPSRAAILTGRYGSSNGVTSLNSFLKPAEKTVASYLRSSGYQTAMIGKWHIGQSPQDLGFDYNVYFNGNGEYYGRSINDRGKMVKPAQHCDEYSVDRGIDFLKEAVKNDKPFFLFQCTQLPHMDGKLLWNAKLETLNKYDRSKMPVASNRLDDLSGKPPYLKEVRNRTQALEYHYPDVDAIQKHTLEYYSVITEMDDALGRLLAVIRELKVEDNTYIIFMSDNGWMLGEHGFTSKVLPYNNSVRVPLFILGPGINGHVNDNIVLNIDLAPTILDLAGVKKPAAIQGKSMLPLLFNKEVSWRKAFVYEGIGTYGGAKPHLAVYDNSYRYIVTYQDSTLKSAIFRELYDLKKDGNEMHNIIKDPAYSQVINDFDKYIKDFQKLN